MFSLFLLSHNNNTMYKNAERNDEFDEREREREREFYMLITHYDEK